MNLKEFVKEILIELDSAVDEARDTTSRDIHFSEKDDRRTVEFDIAVTSEESDSKKGKAGVRVLQFAEAGGDLSKTLKNSTVSRVSFGLQISRSTKDETRATNEAVKRHNAEARRRNSSMFNPGQSY